MGAGLAAGVDIHCIRSTWVHKGLGIVRGKEPDTINSTLLIAAAIGLGKNMPTLRMGQGTRDKALCTTAELLAPYISRFYYRLLESLRRCHQKTKTVTVLRCHGTGAYHSSWTTDSSSTSTVTDSSSTRTVTAVRGSSGAYHTRCISPSRHYHRVSTPVAMIRG